MTGSRASITTSASIPYNTRPKEAVGFVDLFWHGSRIGKSSFCATSTVALQTKSKGSKLGKDGYIGTSISFDCHRSDIYRECYRDGCDSVVYIFHIKAVEQLGPAVVSASKRLGSGNTSATTRSTGCIQSLDLAKPRLDTCIASHPECQVQNPDTSPKRLLSLGSCLIRLVVSSALSHCWGTIKQLRLRKTTSSKTGIKSLKTDCPKC